MEAPWGGVHSLHNGVLSVVCLAAIVAMDVGRAAISQRYVSQLAHCLREKCQREMLQLQCLCIRRQQQQQRLYPSGPGSFSSWSSHPCHLRKWQQQMMLQCSLQPHQGSSPSLGSLGCCNSGYSSDTSLSLWRLVLKAPSLHKVILTKRSNLLRSVGMD